MSQQKNTKNEEIVRDKCKKYLNETINVIGHTEYGYGIVLVTFYGGDISSSNKKGEWIKYLNALKELLEGLESEFDKVWLIDLNSGYVNDVFSVRIAIAIHNEDKKVN